MRIDDDLITTPYWWEAGAPHPAAFAEDPPREVDLAVIGGGYTGMSAALTAAEAGAEVLVLDAAMPGEGASTRNGGMIGAPHRAEVLNLLGGARDDVGRRMIAEGVEAYAHTRALYTDRGIDAGYRQTGRIQLAYTQRHFEAMKRQADTLNAIADQGVQILAPEEIGQHIRTDRYFGAILFPDHGGLHPRMAHDGLTRLAMAAGARVAAPCAVTAIAEDGDGFRLMTERGEVRARRLVMATNGYTTPVHRWISRRIFRIPSFLMATEPLPPEVIDRVAPARMMMVESRARHSYFRPSPDGTRILFGGRAALHPIGLRKAAETLGGILEEIWPEAANWRVTHCWTGFTGFTFARVPHVGEKDGAHFAMGYCGNGVALSPWLGSKVAYRALGDPRGQTAFAETPWESRPYHFGGAPWFMPLVSAWWSNVVDGADIREAARDRASR
ncbi:MAG: FAD-binding oxidoreductase [Pseudomonadota bacterium]